MLVGGGDATFLGSFQGFINDRLAFFSSGPTVVPSYPLLSEKKQEQEEEIGKGEKKVLSKGE